MSLIATIMLVTGCEEDDDRIPDLNDRLRDSGWDDWVFRQLADAFGGDKIAAPIFGGAVKHFDLGELTGALRSIPWRKPGAVQVMLHNSVDFRWQLLDFSSLP
jgi:hypothetical protein